MPAAVLTIDINARLANLEAAVAKIPGTLGQATKGIDAQLGGLNNKLVTFGRTAAAAFGIPIGAAATLAFLKSVGEQAAEGERSVNQLNAVLKATGGAVGLTSRELAGITDSLRDTTIFDDDDIRKAETALLRFRTVQGETFREAIALAPDVAAALGTDLVSAATALGRALSDPETGMKALKAAGLSLSEQQKDLAADLIASGDKARAQKIVLEELRKSVAGAGESDNTGLYGATRRLSRAWGELQKAMGQGVFRDGSALSTAATILDNVAKSASSARTDAAGLFDLLSRRSAIDITRDLFAGRDPRRPRQVVSGKIGGEVFDAEKEKADAAAAAEAERQLDEQRYLDRRSNIKRIAALTTNAEQERLVNLRRDLDVETQLREAAYKDNEVSVSTFYDKQRAAAQAAATATLGALAKEGEAIEQQYNAATGKDAREERRAAELQLSALGVRTAQAKSDLARELTRINIQESDSIKNLREQYEGLGIQLAQLRGDDVAAANLSFKTQNRDLFDRLKSQITTGSPSERNAAQEALETLTATQRLVDIRARLNEASKDYSLTLDELAITIDRINTGEQSGALTSLQALERKSNANALYVGILKQELVTLEAIAQQSGRREDIVRVEQLKAGIEQLAAQTDLLAQKFNDIGKGEFSQLLQNIANSKNLKQDWKQIILSSFDSVTAKLNGVAADEISQRLFGKDGALSGFGGFFSKIFGGDKGAGGTAVVQSQILQLGSSSSGTALAMNAVTSAAQSAAVALANVGGGGGAGGLGSLFGGGSGFGGPDSSFSFPENPYVGPGFGTYAGGTNSARGGLSWVGEFGKELMYVPPRSTIVPNHRIGAGSGSRSLTVINNNTIMPGANRQTALQAAKRAGDAVRSRVLRFGN